MFIDVYRCLACKTTMFRHVFYRSVYLSTMFRSVFIGFYTGLYRYVCFSASTWLNDVKRSLPFTKERCSSIVWRRFWAHHLGPSWSVPSKPWPEEFHSWVSLLWQDLDFSPLCLWSVQIFCGNNLRGCEVPVSWLRSSYVLLEMFDASVGIIHFFRIIPQNPVGW